MTTTRAPSPSTGLTAGHPAGLAATPDPAGERLHVLAADWLAAEDRSIAEPRRGDLVRLAMRAAKAYEDRLAGGTADDIERAWESASVRQASELTGTPAWLAARRVAELLRLEHEARRTDRP